MSSAASLPKTANIGIIGCGRAAQLLHLPALRKLAAAKVIMASDVDKEKLDAIQTLDANIAISEDYNEVIGNPDVHIVAVWTPAFLHKEIAIKALNAGKHVFIEKPLALTLSDCDELIETGSNSIGRATVGFNLRFHRLVRKAQSMILGGAIGRIESVRSVWTGSMRQKEEMPPWRAKRELGGSALFEVGVHHFDLWKFLMGEPIEEISARAKIAGGIERSVVVNAMSSSGVPISAFFSDWTADSNELEVFGDRGVITISLYRVDGLRHHSLSDFSGGMSTRLKDAKQQISSLAEFPKSISLGGDYKSSYYHEWENFIGNIQDSQEPSPSLVDGRYATQVALAASQSAQSNLPVSLGNTPTQLISIN
jgi:predicted dehydrogenase